MAFMMYEIFRVTRTHESVPDYSDSETFDISMTFKDLTSDGTKFYCQSARYTPDDILESLCKRCLRESDQVKIVLTCYEQEIEQLNSQPNYQKLKTMMKRCLDQKIRARNFEARYERIEKGHGRKAKGNQPALQGSQESAINGKQKGSAQEETHAVSATTNPSCDSWHPPVCQNRAANSLKSALL